MNIKESRKFYEKFYLHEANKQESLYTRMRLALPIFAFITSASLFWAEGILRAIANFDAMLDTLSLSVTAFSIVIFLYLCYCICRGLVGWKYYEIPLSKLGRYHDKLKQRYGKYRSEHGKQKVESMIQEAFEEKVIEWLAKCAEHNQRINQRRAAYVAKCFVALPLYLFALVSLYFVFYIR